MVTKAISTRLSNFFVFIVRLCGFVVLGNPWSMFWYNLLFPRDAAAYAKDRNIFGPRIYAFYERMAQKWPFYWAKWWIKIDNLPKYSVKQQVKYLFKVAFPNQTEIAALKAMGTKEFWPQVYDELFFKYGTLVLPLRRKDLGYRDELPDWYDCKVVEFMAQNLRLSYGALKEFIALATKDSKLRFTLKGYLASGKLNDDQFELLIGVIAANNTDQQMTEVLTDYVKRYGISDEHMQKVKKEFPKNCVTLVEKASVLYIQMKALKAFKDTDEGCRVWTQFCKEVPELLPEVQCLMSPRQYAIFHNSGHKLCNMAIVTFLSKQNGVLWRSVFVNEKETCKSGYIRNFIRSSPMLELAYREAVEVQNEANTEQV